MSIMEKVKEKVALIKEVKALAGKEAEILDLANLSIESLEKFVDYYSQNELGLVEFKAHYVAKIPRLADMSLLFFAMHSKKLKAGQVKNFNENPFSKQLNPIIPIEDRIDLVNREAFFFKHFDDVFAIWKWEKYTGEKYEDYSSITTNKIAAKVAYMEATGIYQDLELSNEMVAAIEKGVHPEVAYKIGSALPDVEIPNVPRKKLSDVLEYIEEFKELGFNNFSIAVLIGRGRGLYSVKHWAKLIDVTKVGYYNAEISAHSLVRLHNLLDLEDFSGEAIKALASYSIYEVFRLLVEGVSYKDLVAHTSKEELEEALLKRELGD